MITNILGEHIRELRIEENLNQKEFAKILNVQNTTLSQYENGINIPSDEMKIKIGDFFDVSIDYLLGRSDNRKPDEIYSNVFHSISDDGLTKEDIDIVKAMIEQLKKKNKHELTNNF